VKKKGKQKNRDELNKASPGSLEKKGQKRSVGSLWGGGGGGGGGGGVGAEGKEKKNDKEA